MGSPRLRAGRPPLAAAGPSAGVLGPQASSGQQGPPPLCWASVQGHQSRTLGTGQQGTAVTPAVGIGGLLTLDGGKGEVGMTKPRCPPVARAPGKSPCRRAVMAQSGRQGQRPACT